MNSILDSIHKNNLILRLAEIGFSSETIKSCVYCMLAPYFTDEAALKNNILGRLSVECVNVMKIQTTLRGDVFLRRIINIYRDAYKADAERTLSELAGFDENTERANKSFWNACAFEIKKDNLDLEQFRFECFRNIGDISEACLQPYLREGLLMLLLSRGENPTKDSIMKLTFGEVVQRFHNLVGLDDLLVITPWKLSVSQWRNVAQHHSCEVVSGNIKVSYGNSIRPKSLILSRDQTFKIAKDISLRLAVFKAAKTLFIFDHVHELSKFYEPSEVRVESYSETVLDLSVMFASQGFKLIEVKLEESIVSVSLLDLQSESDPKRIMNCSQFVVTTWINFKRPKVEVNYLNSAGKLCWSFLAIEEGLTQVVTEAGVDFDRLANFIEFKRSE